MNAEEKKKRLRALLAQLLADENKNEGADASYGVEMTEGTPLDPRSLGSALERVTDDPDFSEAIVLVQERPVVFVRGDAYDPLSAPWTALNVDPARSLLRERLGAIGRIEVPSNPLLPYAGTGFLVGDDLVMTNRHVAELFADGLGTSVSLRSGGAQIDFLREQPTESLAPSATTFARVVMIHPYWDMALLQVKGLPAGRKPLSLSVRPPEELLGRDIVVVGYPARDGRNDLAVQDRIFNSSYSVKRLAPGKIRDRETIQSFGHPVSALVHDASTLGGNSGSAVIDLATGEVVGLHFAGEYLRANYCVPMYELACDARIQGLNFAGARPSPTSTASVAWGGSEAAPVAAPCSQNATTIDIRITVNGNAVSVGCPPPPAAPPPPPRPPSPRPRRGSPIAKRLAVAQMLKVTDQGKRQQLESAAAESPTGPLDAAWLAQIEQKIRALDAKPLDEIEQYRDFYKQPEMTVARARQILEQMRLAIGSPEAFFDAAQATPTVEEGAMSWLSNMIATGLSLPDPLTEDEQQGLAQLRADYQLGNDIIINPKDHTFETSDPGYWHLLKADKWDLRHWPDGLAPFIRHDEHDPKAFIYDAKPDTTKVALFSDFGVGQYQSRFIAKQLTERAYRYAFHCGDVYYGGTEAEFAHNYTSVLDPLMNKTTLFSIPENHELYSGGFAYQNFIRTELAKGRTVQQGSYFCVRFKEHQIVAIDVNWNGRQRYEDEKLRLWLEGVLSDGRDLTTILLTGSAPYCYGKTSTTKLYENLANWHTKDRFHIWFWGDDHYCALFKRTEQHRFVGSCIGHGGFPGDRQKDKQPSAAPVDWVEAAPRFPDGYNVQRDDLNNNGWVEMTLAPGGGLELRYLDWLGTLRMQTIYRMNGSGDGRHLEPLPGQPLVHPRRVGPFRD